MSRVLGMFEGDVLQAMEIESEIRCDSAFGARRNRRLSIRTLPTVPFADIGRSRPRLPRRLCEFGLVLVILPERSPLRDLQGRI